MLDSTERSNLWRRIETSNPSEETLASESVGETPEGSSSRVCDDDDGQGGRRRPLDGSWGSLRAVCPTWRIFTPCSHSTQYRIISSKHTKEGMTQPVVPALPVIDCCKKRRLIRILYEMWVRIFPRIVANRQTGLRIRSGWTNAASRWHRLLLADVSDCPTWTCPTRTISVLRMLLKSVLVIHR